MKTVKIKMTFTEETLGTCAANPDVFREYIASKNPKGVDESELKNLRNFENLEEAVTDQMTIFPRNADNRLLIYDFQIKGKFKQACSALRRVKSGECKTKSSDLKAYKKVIDDMIFVFPREIILAIPEGHKPDKNDFYGVCTRFLRAETPQGPRVCIACSETVPPGTCCEFEVRMLDDFAEYLYEWLDYGQYHGMLQWRNSGKGRFTYELLDGAKAKKSA